MKLTKGKISQWLRKIQCKGGKPVTYEASRKFKKTDATIFMVSS